MANTKYTSTEEMIEKLQSLKGRTKLKFYKNISIFYTEMKNRNFQTQEDTYAKNAQEVSKIYHDVFLVMNFVKTKPQIKNMNIIFYDVYYTVIKVRDEIKDIDNQYENDDNDYINFQDFITLNHYIGIKNNNEILR